MNTYRSIQRIVTADEVQLGPAKIRQALPVHGLRQVSPFILLHHFNLQVAPGALAFDVPPHPHRGFCPITFMFEGSIQHEDSLGNKKVIGDNEVQWINAGRGIIHGETTGKDFMEHGGRFQGIQLWINLPAAQKMNPPSYQPITKEEIILIEEDGVQFRLVSGEWNGQYGPAKSPVLTAMLRMDADSTFHCPRPATHNVLIYVLEGSIQINETTTAEQYELVIFDQAEGDVLIRANDAAKLLLMSGEPIDEPLVTHGPYVMNTQTEIMEAMRDYKDGKMGFLY